MSVEPPSPVVVTLPAVFKAPPGELMLVPVDPSKCLHLRVTYEVDLRAGKCRCRACQAEVSPMFVLEQLMHEESHWMQSRASYQDEMQRLRARSHAKCNHCGKMTRISNR